MAPLLRNTRSTWPDCSAALSEPRSAGVVSVVVPPSAMVAPRSSIAPVIVARVASDGSAEFGGCAQASAGWFSGRAITLLWQLEQTVPGGVAGWLPGIVHWLVTLGGGTGLLRGARL